MAKLAEYYPLVASYQNNFILYVKEPEDVALPSGPKFLEPLETKELISGHPFSWALPEIDQDGDELIDVLVDLGQISSYVSFDADTNTFSYSGDRAIE